MIDGNAYGEQHFIALANGTLFSDNNYNVYSTNSETEKPLQSKAATPSFNDTPAGPQRANVSRLGGATPTIANPINLPNNFTGI